MKTKYSSIIERNIQMFSELKTLVSLVLESHTEPLSAREVHVAVQTLADRKIDNVSVRNALRRLEKDGLVASRVETAKERAIRYGGAGARQTSGPARLFAFGKTVPTRTQVEVIPGERLKAGGRPTGRKNKVRPARVAKVKTVQSFQVQDVIEALVQERTSKLQARVAELEDRLARIKKLV